MNKTEQLQKVQKILHEQVGEVKTHEYKDGRIIRTFRVPKLYATVYKFTSHLKNLKQDGNTEYAGLDINFILDFCAKGKTKKIARTTLKQLNHNGKTDTILVIGKKKEEVIYG